MKKIKTIMSIFCKGYKMLDKVLEIEKGNNFIQYIIKRIKTQNYRGIHLSQHNRYDFDYVKNIISVIYNEVKNECFEIPRGDYSEKSGAKKDYNPNDYPIFKKIVNTIKKITNIGIFSPNVIQRSETPKKEYFQLHKINKDKNFELHHIVAISKARNKTEVEILKYMIRSSRRKTILDISKALNKERSTIQRRLKVLECR
jgi:hypothetical protein